MIGSFGIIKGNAPIITLETLHIPLYIPLLIPELAVADLAVLVPVHGADHGVNLSAGYLAFITPVYSSQYSSHCPPTLPGRWFITN